MRCCSRDDSDTGSPYPLLRERHGRLSEGVRVAACDDRHRDRDPATQRSPRPKLRVRPAALEGPSRRTVPWQTSATARRSREIEAKQLAPEIRRELSTLDRANADAVARHLVAAGELLDDDPEAALSHARAARARSGRIAAVREAVGIAAYQCGGWAQAIAELRARVEWAASPAAAVDRRLRTRPGPAGTGPGTGPWRRRRPS